MDRAFTRMEIVRLASSYLNIRQVNNNFIGTSNGKMLFALCRTKLHSFISCAWKMRETSVVEWEFDGGDFSLNSLNHILLLCFRRSKHQVCKPRAHIQVPFFEYCALVVELLFTRFILTHSRFSFWILHNSNLHHLPPSKEIQIQLTLCVSMLSSCFLCCHQSFILTTTIQLPMIAWKVP